VRHLLYCGTTLQVPCWQKSLFCVRNYQVTALDSSWLSLNPWSPAFFFSTVNGWQLLSNKFSSCSQSQFRFFFKHSSVCPLSYLLTDLCIIWKPLFVMNVCVCRLPLPPMQLAGTCTFMGLLHPSQLAVEERFLKMNAPQILRQYHHHLDRVEDRDFMFSLRCNHIGQYLLKKMSCCRTCGQQR